MPVWESHGGAFSAIRNHTRCRSRERDIELPRCSGNGNQYRAPLPSNLRGCRRFGPPRAPVKGTPRASLWCPTACRFRPAFSITFCPVTGHTRCSYTRSAGKGGRQEVRRVYMYVCMWVAWRNGGLAGILTISGMAGHSIRRGNKYPG